MRGLVLGLRMGIWNSRVWRAPSISMRSGWEEDWPPDFIGGYGVGFRMDSAATSSFVWMSVAVTDFELLDKKTRTRFYIGWDY
ncbi:MAG: hypothetical protein R3E97_23595 [Candidatus Eisenbacteria bacterium]